MIASSKHLLYAWISLLAVGAFVPARANAQFKPPEIPKVEAPKPPEAPKAPELPELPPGEEEAPKPKKPAIPTRKVIGHKKQWVILPRFGAIRTLSVDGSESVDQVSAGLDAQISFQEKFYVTGEANLIYVQTGSYGLAYVPRTGSLYEVGTGNFTSLVGLGAGMYTSFLDKNEIWSRLGIKVGYLAPFYVPIWLTGDFEKEVRRTRNSYFNLSASPIVGVAIPVRTPVLRADYFPDPLAEEGDEEQGMAFRLLLGVRISVAFIFAPRG